MEFHRMLMVLVYPEDLVAAAVLLIPQLLREEMEMIHQLLHHKVILAVLVDLMTTLQVVLVAAVAVALAALAKTVNLQVLPEVLVAMEALEYNLH